MTPIVGIFCAFRENESYIHHYYAHAVESAGALPVLLPLVKNDESIARFTEVCDGFIFAGGHDVCPERYGEPPSQKLGTTSPERDRIEFSAFALAHATGKPIMGICRGSQLINVALGGSLYQDLADEYGDKLEHKGLDKHTARFHDINLSEGTPLFEMADGTKQKINSLHHQAIKRLADGLVPMAHADDGIIEAAYLPSHHYLRIFQWHPEKLYEDSMLSRNIFADFIKHVESYSTLH